jgi:hypothetical protein
MHTSVLKLVTYTVTSYMLQPTMWPLQEGEIQRMNTLKIKLLKYRNQFTYIK